MADLSKYLSERIAQLPETKFVKILRMAGEAKGVTSLGPGEPDFDTPKVIRDYAKKKLDEGYTHYSPAGGRTDLKKLIARKLKKDNKIPITDFENEIIVTAGSTEAIMMASMALLDPGEEVLVPNPGFLAYIPTVELMNGFALPMRLSEETGFQIDLDALKGSVSKRTRAMIICSPGNPTGTVLKRKVLEELADIVVENELIVLSDEAYEKLAYDGAKHISFGSLNGMEDYTVTLHSFSKTFAMPGFRLGYAAGPSWLIKEMTKIHLYTSLCANTLSQLAGMKALQIGYKETEKMRKEYARRRQLILKRIDEIDGLHIAVKPEGAFYAFPRFKSRKNCFAFAEWLLKEAKVLVVPGLEFGKGGANFIRLSYATEYALIEKAMDRIEKAMKKNR